MREDGGNLRCFACKIVHSGLLMESPNGYVRLELLFLPNGKWAVLGRSETLRGGVHLIISTDPDGTGKWQYTMRDLQRRLAGWTHLGHAYDQRATHDV